MRSRSDRAQLQSAVEPQTQRAATAQGDGAQSIARSPRATAQLSLVRGIEGSPREVARRQAVQHVLQGRFSPAAANMPLQLKAISEVVDGDLVVDTEYKVKKDGGEWRYATYKGKQGEVDLSVRPVRFIQSHSVQFLHALNSTTLKDTDEFLPTDRTPEVIAAEKSAKSYDDVVAKLKSEWEAVKGGFDLTQKFVGDTIKTGFWGVGKENARLTPEAAAALTEGAIAASLGIDTELLKIVVGGSQGAAGAMHILVQRKNLAVGEKSLLNFHMLNPVG
jgi:hypothetical protein